MWLASSDEAWESSAPKVAVLEGAAEDAIAYGCCNLRVGVATSCSAGLGLKGALLCPECDEAGRTPDRRLQGLAHALLPFKPNDAADPNGHHMNPN